MDLSIFLGVIGALGVLFTVFFYFMPLDRLRSQFEKIGLEQFSKTLNLRDKYKVAIIDDEIESFPIEFIRSMGFEVKTFESISFTDSLEIAKYDVVFLDVKGVVKEDLDEGGAKFIKILKQARSLLPVVAVSSGKFQAALNDYFRSSDETINKPIEEFKVREILMELKSDFFDFDKMLLSLKDRIRQLPVDKKSKFRLESQIVKYFSTQLPKEGVLSLVHQIATVDSENIIKLINKMKDRIDYD